MKTTTTLYRSIFVAGLSLSALLPACLADGTDDTEGTIESADDVRNSKSSDAAANATLKFITQFDPAQGELPEGLAITADGTTAYVGFAPTGKIVKISLSSGEVSDFGSVPPPPPNGGFVTGIAIDSAGNVYVASASPAGPSVFQPGVYKIPVTGGAGTLFADDSRFALPNGLAFDKKGNLFVTDSGAGAVFRVTPSGKVSQWIADPLLQGDTQNPCTLGLGFPLGANGLAISGSNVFVSNTDKASLVKIPITYYGTAGKPVEIAKSDATCSPLRGADGIAAGRDGGILVAANASNALVRVGSYGERQTLVAGGELDFPASVAFGTMNGQRYAFITNFALFSAMSGGTPRPGLLSFGPLK